MLTLIAQITNPVVTTVGSGDGGTALGILMARLFRAVVMVGGLALLLFIAMGGLAWITAGGDEKKVEGARNRITNGIIGMIALVASAAIAAFVGNMLGVDLLNPTLSVMPAATP